jgi:FkbM family methyltransferase
MVPWAFIKQVGPVKWFFRYGALQFRKRVLKRPSTLLLPTGSTVYLPLNSGFATEVYVTNADVDWGAEQLLARFADPNRDFLDIGAHFGYFSVYLAPLLRRAYAFEPSTRILPDLHNNAGRTPKVEVVESAVSHYDGEAEFHFGRGTPLGSLEDVGGDVTKVKVTTIDTFVKQHGDVAPCLVKTDIEGHDIAALKGMNATVLQHQPIILSEICVTQELADLCDSWNYSIFANVRDRKTLRTTYRQLSMNDRDYWYKMLILVPESLHPDFVAMTQK